MVKVHASISSTKQSQEYHEEVYSASQDMMTECSDENFL